MMDHYGADVGVVGPSDWSEHKQAAGSYISAVALLSTFCLVRCWFPGRFWEI